MTHEAGDTSPAAHSADRLCRGEPFGQARSRPSEQRRERMLRPAAAKYSQPSRGGADEDTGEPLVGRDEAGGAAGAVAPLISFGRNIREVPVEDRAPRAALPHHMSARLVCDGGPDAVRADCDRGPEVDG